MAVTRTNGICRVGLLKLDQLIRLGRAFVRRAPSARSSRTTTPQHQKFGYKTESFMKRTVRMNRRSSTEPISASDEKSSAKKRTVNRNVVIKQEVDIKTEEAVEGTEEQPSTSPRQKKAKRKHIEITPDDDIKPDPGSLPRLRPAKRLRAQLSVLVALSFSPLRSNCNHSDLIFMKMK
jgi:hypothetical protein